jgi:WD40 repeat protein
MNLAEKHWYENHARRARELLESQMPNHTGGVDLRGWEWHYLWRLSHSELRRLQFLPNCLAFSPDGQLLVAGNLSGTLKMWDASGTHIVRTIKAHTNAVSDLMFRSDGRVFATVSGGIAKLWDTATGRELRTFPGGRVSLSPDGYQLAIGTDVITIWDTSSGKDLRTLKGHSGIRQLAFSPNGQRLASCGGGTVRLWDVTTGRQLWLFSEQKQDVWSIAFSPDGKILVVGTIEDGVIKALDVETGRQTKTFAGNKERINHLAFNRNGTRLASISNRTLKLWDPVSGGEIQTLRGHHDTIRGLAVSPRDDLIASGGEDVTIRLWDTASRQEPTSLPHPGVSSIAYSGDGKRLAIGGGGVIAVRDALTDQRLWEEGESISSNVRFHPTSRSLASGLEDGRVRLRDAQDGRVLRTFKAHDSLITSIDFSSDGRVLATGGQDKRVGLWNPVDGRRLATLNGHTDAIKAVTFNPDGKLLASAGAEKDRTVRIWDIPTGRAVRTIPIVQLTPSTDDGEKLADDKDYSVWSMVFSHDGRQLFAGLGGNTAALDFIISCLDVQTGETTRVYRGHALSVSGLSLSADGRRLASSSVDRSVRIWDVETAQEVLTFPLPKFSGNTRDEGLSVAFSPDGTRLTASASNHVLIWDARPLTDELRAELNDVNRVESLLADERVESLLAEKDDAIDRVGQLNYHRLSADVIAALESDTTISESVRNRAIDRARKKYQLALRSAKAACELAPAADPDSDECFTKLGVAHYQVGDWTLAIKNLEKSNELYFGGFIAHNPTFHPTQQNKNDTHIFAYNALFLAMAHWQLGQKDEARQWYVVADRCRQTLQPDNDLLRLQNESADLSELKKAPVAARRLGDDPELEFYTFLLETNPQAAWVAWAYDCRGYVHQRLHHIEQAQADRLKAVEVYTQRIKANPNDARAYMWRAHDYCELERWREAARDFQQARRFESQPVVELFNDFWGAIASLMSADTSGYRAACADLLLKMADTKETSQAWQAAWACAIGPKGVDDYATAVALAKKVVEAEPPEAIWLLGGLLYRAGRYPETLERLPETASAASKSPYSWYFLAMAHHAAGRAEKSRECLKKGNDLAGQAPLGQNWSLRATRKLLRQEAEALVQSSAENRPAQKKEAKPDSKPPPPPQPRPAPATAGKK